jgi:hypothetical protein
MEGDLMMNYLLTVEQVGRILQVDPTTVRRYIYENFLNAIGLPCKDPKRKTWRIPTESLAAMLNMDDTRLQTFLPDSYKQIDRPEEEIVPVVEINEMPIL